MKQRSSQKPSGGDSTKSKSRLPIVPIAVVVVALVGLATWQLPKFRSNPAPKPVPAVDTSEFEPVIAKTIEKALADVNESPFSGEAWGTLGSVLRIYDLKEQAMACFEQAGKLDRDNPRWPYFHGQLLLPDHSAIPHLSKAVQVGSGSPEILRLRLARALAEHGQTREALSQLNRFSSSHPAAALERAYLASAAGEWQQVIQEIQPALSSPHTARSAHQLLARAQHRVDDSEAGTANQQKAETLPPDLDWPDPFAAETLIYEQGRKLLADRAQQYLQWNRTDTAAPLISRLIQDYPQAPEGWLFLGGLQLSQNDCAEAERAFRRHLKLSPNSINGLSQLGNTLLCLQRHAEAARTFERVIQLKPDFGQAHFNLGFALAQAGTPTKAIPAFRAAIRYNPEFVDPYITLADLLGQMNQRPEAERLLTRARQIAPQDPRIGLLLKRIRGK